MTNPFALNGIIGGITSNLTVDTGFSQTLMLQLARSFRSLNAAAIPSTTFPAYPVDNYGPYKQSVLLPEPQADAAAVATFMDTAPPRTVAPGTRFAPGSTVASGSTVAPGSTVVPTTPTTVYELPGFSSADASAQTACN